MGLLAGGTCRGSPSPSATWRSRGSSGSCCARPERGVVRLCRDDRGAAESVHLVLNLVAAAACLAAACGRRPGFARLDARARMPTAVPVLLGIALAGWLAVIVVTEVPAAWRRGRRPRPRRPCPRHARSARPRRRVVRRRRVSGPDHPSLWPGRSRPADRKGPRSTRLILDSRLRMRVAARGPGRTRRPARLAEAAAAAMVAPVTYAARPGTARTVLRRTCWVVSVRQPVLRVVHGVLLHPPGREQLRLSAEHVRGWLVAVQLRQPGAVQHDQPPLLPGLFGGPGDTVPGRLPLRRRRLQQLQDLLRRLPLRAMQHADPLRDADHVPAHHLRDPLPDRLSQLQLLRARSISSRARTRRGASDGRHHRAHRRRGGGDRRARVAGRSSSSRSCGATPRSCGGCPRRTRTTSTPTADRWSWDGRRAQRKVPRRKPRSRRSSRAHGMR